MDNELIAKKANSQNILVEINNLKKYMNGLSNNVKSEKIESFIEIINQNIVELQNKAEDYYNERYDKEIDTFNK